MCVSWSVVFTSVDLTRSLYLPQDVSDDDSTTAGGGGVAMSDGPDSRKSPSSNFSFSDIGKAGDVWGMFGHMC